MTYQDISEFIFGKGGFNMMKKIITSILLTLCMAFLMICCLSAVAAVDATPLLVNVEATATITTSGEMVYFSFTPSETGTYIFNSSGDSDTYGYLYDADLTQITSNDDGGPDSHFLITRELIAGTQCYFGSGILPVQRSVRFRFCSVKNSTGR